MRSRQNLKWTILALIVAGGMVALYFTAVSRPKSEGLVYATDAKAKGRFASLRGHAFKEQNCIFVEGGSENEPVLLVWPQNATATSKHGRIIVSLNGRELNVPGAAYIGGSSIPKNSPLVPKHLGCDREIRGVFLVGNL